LLGLIFSSSVTSSQTPEVPMISRYQSISVFKVEQNAGMEGNNIRIRDIYTMPHTVLIADDSELIRNAIRRI
jgi:hypothetical protein